jgi:predicted HicB family RNase H-like nuclease
MMYYVSMTRKDMKVITVRVPSEIHAKVLAAAKEDRRSITAYLQIVIEEHLAVLAAGDQLHE